MSVTVLGSAGTYPGPGNACTGFLVRAAGTTLLVDAGPGTLANLQRHVAPTELDAVVLSHSHPDHWLDVPVMRNALRYVFGVEGLPLYLTAETLELAERLCIGGLGSAFAPSVVSDGAGIDIDGVHLGFSRTDHPVETLAMRFDAEGRSLAYTADTGPDWSVGELGRGVDLVLSEATFVDDTPDPAPVHLTARQAGDGARRADAGRLVLTHLLPTVPVAAAVSEASEAYGAEVDVAEVHRTFEV